LNRIWLEPQGNRAPDAFQDAIGGHALVSQVLFERGLASVESARSFLDPDAFSPIDPAELPGISEAADRVKEAIRCGEQVCVWGDFDVDGQTSTTLLVSALLDLGAQVSFHIPVRERESHGVSLTVFKELHDRQGFGLVVTCDTGITAHEAVDYARSIGVDFVITDHHELPSQLPMACSVVNPRLLPPGHPSASLPGAGTAYKLVQELYRRQGRWEDTEKYLDLVALGIVADVAYQTGETRYLLQRGLAALRNPCRAGLIALYEMAELNPLGLTEEHIGYLLAPRLNAIGRLSDANPVLELLTTPDIGRARMLANHLEGLNARRKLLTDQVFQAAQDQLERDPGLLNEPALVLSNPFWPAGVIGIVASRLVERYTRPVILFSAPISGIARGSGRSIEGINITHAIAGQQKILLGFGGHAMAAGLSLKTEHIPEFRKGFCCTVEEMLGERTLPERSLQIDAYIPLSDLTHDLVLDLERLAPFGAGNPPLTLVSQSLRLRSSKAIGRGGEHLQLILEDEQGHKGKVIWWQGADWGLERPVREGETFDLAYHARMGDFRGAREVQIEYVDIRLQTRMDPTISLETPTIQVIDHRQQPQPLARLQQLLEAGEITVWAEAEATGLLQKRGIAVQDRYNLFPASRLAIWTIPPGRAELASALEAVSPDCVYLLGLHPGTELIEAFVSRLAGLVKYALYTKASRTGISQLAVATAHREATVRKGLAWLEAMGHICVREEKEGEIELKLGGGQRKPELALVEKQLKALLEETAAFRKYFVAADAPSLVESPKQE
jgi:single-stranded-DNA-specific exonuclease